ncbi:hypothetical protein ACFX13_019268 [Malus domestica]
MRRKFNIRNRRIFIIDQCLGAVTSGGIPGPAQPIIAAGDDNRAIPIEIDGGDRVEVSRQNLQAFPGLNIPNTHRFVEGTRDDHIGLWVEVGAEDVVGVAIWPVATSQRRRVLSSEAETMKRESAEKARSEMPWEWPSKVWAGEMVGVEESSRKAME